MRRQNDLGKNPVLKLVLRLALFCSLFRKSLFLACTIALPMLAAAEAAFFAETIADLTAAIVTSALFARFFPRVLAAREERTAVAV